MVQITSLSIESIGVGVGSLELCNEIREIITCTNNIIGAGFDLIDCIFHGVGVQVAHDDEIGIAAASWICGKPIDQCFCRGSACLAAVALTIIKIRVARTS